MAEQFEAPTPRAVDGDAASGGAGTAIGRLGVRPVPIDQLAAVIAVPVFGSDLDALQASWDAAVADGADLVEWRVDLVPSDLRTAAAELISAWRSRDEMPVLATIRTAAESGQFDLESAGEDGSAVQPSDTSPAREIADRTSGAASAHTTGMVEYGRLVRAYSQWADAVDIEIALPGVAHLVAEARSAGVVVVGSYHAVATPASADQIRDALRRARDLGAEVAKVATAAPAARDVDAALAAQQWALAELGTPSVVIAMGRLGAVTRVGAPARASAFTFATAADSSAPGQLSVAEVRARS